MIYHIGYVTDEYSDFLKLGDVFKENEHFKFENDKKDKTWYVISHKQKLSNAYKVLHSIYLTDNKHGTIGTQDGNMNNKPYNCINVEAVVAMKNGQALDINDKLTAIKFQNNYIFISNGLSICSMSF